eukprot:CAMPEP_0117011626 /NCGR_PEP_ID=MMETSP0472-20121206/9960_1 /TAXON_ID=693140 ORGANISM="Tiarina fusus, Strain LIS" /NCGR_SAMPLE_ID=MMETSP0472 /ASSEMBLY_ACC=CAM_ASM_000603 /LENGTH=199 /DNA_ID=CAMNT_0004714491 /DNA_START=192 /DNA_END=791 /DNA_ORIENTATION=-
MNYNQYTQQGHSGFPQHHRPTQVSHVPENETVGYKRSRDVSPSSAEGGWQQSFKRLKVVSTDEQDSHASWHQQQAQGSVPITQAYQSQHDHLNFKQEEEQQQHQPQIAGQHSSEHAQKQQGNNNPGYQSMNSLLGSLHMNRRRQQHRSGESASHANEHQQQQQQHQLLRAAKIQSQPSPGRNQQHRKRVTNLRISSNLY